MILRIWLSHSSDLLIQSLLELASLLKSISRPVKQCPVNMLLQLSFLVRASLLTSISRPVKLDLTDRLQLQGLLDRALLLLCISLPVKPKLTDLHQQLHPTLQQIFSLQGKVLFTDLTLTDLLLPTGHCLRIRLTPAPLLITGQGEIGSPVFLLRPVACCRITHHWTYTLKDQDQPITDPDQPVSEEQNYRDTMQGIRSFMGWSHIPEMDSTASTSDDNPFAGPKTLTPGKVSVKMPTKDWLCRKLAKLNLTLVEGYPSHGSEAGGLAKDVFLRPARTQSKWYGLHTDPKAESSQISSWNTDASKLNSSYSRIAKYTGLSSTPPASRRISQDTLRRWERSARETSVICNQAASFNRCLKVQQNMKDQLKILKAESKGKGSTKASTAAEELNYLMDFNSSITQAEAKSMEHLSEFVFITLGNLTLIRRDAYLSHLRTGIKPDTFTALRSAPLHISTLFPDSVIKRAEEDIAQLESKGHAGSSQNKGRYHPYERQDKRLVNRDSRSEKPAWKTIGRKQFRRRRTTTFSSRPAKG